MKNFNHSSPFPYKCNFNWDYPFFEDFPDVNGPSAWLEFDMSFLKFILTIPQNDLGCFGPQKKISGFLAFRKTKRLLQLSLNQSHIESQRVLRGQKPLSWSQAALAFPWLRV